MALPIKYNIKNVLVRWRSTVSTILGIGLVVAVYIMVQSLAAGLDASSANTGDPRNLLVVRDGSTSESSSQVSLEQYNIIKDFPGISKGPDGRPLISGDVLILINLPRKADGGEANVLVRGISPAGAELRPQVKLVAGRWFNPGLREVVVSQRLAARFANMEIGQTFKSGAAVLKVVGWTDGQNSAFDSEIWMDFNEARSAFTRDAYSSVLLRAEGTNTVAEIRKKVENDKRLPLLVDSETEYYKSQTDSSKPIKFLGNFLATMMSIGAVFSAMNTMYASVGSRTREVGTLRVLGFRRREILAGFLIEGAFLAFLGGLIGCAGSLVMNGWSTGTLNFQTFSEVVFEFTVTPQLMVQGVVFAVVMGVLGSFLPALRASRLPVIAALKSL